MATPKLPKPLVDMFADIFSLGHMYGKVGEVQTMLEFLSSLYPDVAQLIAAKADLLLRLGKYSEARELLESADARIPRTPVIKAMLAFCLLAQNDSMWEGYARETMELPVDEAARTIVKALASVRGVSIGEGSSSSSSSPSSAAEVSSHLPPMGIAC